MNKKPMGSRATTVSTETLVSTESLSSTDVAASLEQGATRLDAAEEKVLRMRHGVPAARTLVLQQVGQEHPEAREKLLSLELELMRQLRDRQRTAAPAAAAARVEPVVAAATVNPRRDKIVAALRARKTRR